MNPTRVLIVDDHVVVRKGIQMFLSTETSVQVIGEAENGKDAVRKAKDLSPDVILMDLVMPEGDGIEAITEIKHCIQNVKIIVLTTFQEEGRVNAAVDAGADGYLLKDADGDALLQAIHAVRQGDMPLHPHVARNLVNRAREREGMNGVQQLTERQREVLQLVAKGMSNQAVAQVLQISKGTVKVHVSNILSALSVSSRTEAAVRAVQMGLISSNSGTCGDH